MATIAVTADNTRIEDGESATGYSNIGSGPAGASEAAFPYQGSNLFNRKVTSSTGAGFYYNPASDGGAAQDMTTTSLRTMMVKAIVTDYGGIQPTDGFRVRIGSATSAYHAYVIAGSDAVISSLAAYPARGGFIIIPIDPNIAAYRDGTLGAGSPTLTAVDYFGLVAAFATASAKSENVGLDAIDLGTGLTMVGGDGADPDGAWQDFVDEDEGTSANRWGYASSTFDAIKLFFGHMTIGSATATVFNDITSQVVWPDGLFQAGWSGPVVSLAHASTVVTDGATHTGLGDTTAEDTRPDYTVTGTTGAFTFSGILNNFRNLVYTSACTIVNAILECADLTQSNADISDSTIKTRTATGVACINDADFTNLSNIVFEQADAGHAIEITAPATVSLDNITYTGYGADASTAAAIYNNSGGLVTINIINGGATPTIRNGAGASTVINNTKTLLITARDAGDTTVIENVRILLEADTGGPLPAGDSVTIARSGSVATVTHTAHGLATSDTIIIRGAEQDQYNGDKVITVTGANTYTYSVSGTPTTPATGTITATFRIFNELTNASGIVTTTAFPYTSDQPVTGVARKGSTSPLYRTAIVAGTITTAGFTTNVFLVADE